MIEIRVACSPGEARIAVLDDGELSDFALWRPGCPDGIGDHHVVRVTHPAEAMGGAFVVLADGSDGFLTGSHRQDDLVSARVVRSPQGGKGARLRPIDDKVAAGGVRLLSRGPSPLEALAARHTDAPIIIDDAAFLTLLAAELRARVQRTQRAFDPATLDAVESLTSPTAALSGGLTATFSPTPALVAVDLDNPRLAGRVSRPTAQAGANIAAFPSLAAELRLRNFGGAIVIDPAGVTPRKRAALVEPLRAALRQDPLRPEVLGATGLGLLEVVRPRVRPPLHELLTTPHGVGLTALRAIAARRPPGPAARSPILRAGVEVIEALRKDTFALECFSKTYGAPILLDTDPGYPAHHWSEHS